MYFPLHSTMERMHLHGVASAYTYMIALCPNYFLLLVVLWHQRNEVSLQMQEFQTNAPLQDDCKSYQQSVLQTDSFYVLQYRSNCQIEASLLVLPSSATAKTCQRVRCKQVACSEWHRSDPTLGVSRTAADLPSAFEWKNLAIAPDAFVS